jgi:hypothetical protein
LLIKNFIAPVAHFLDTPCILDAEQIGFRTNSSIITATFNLMNETIDALNSEKIVGGIFCYLKKAYNSVGQEILQHKR